MVSQGSAAYAVHHLPFIATVLISYTSTPIITVTVVRMALQNPTNSTIPSRLSWVPQPNQRGTVDIIWSCLTTLAFCVWTILHLNVPASTDTDLKVFVRRSRWMMFAILAPELVMLFACGQWTSAKRSVADMQNSGHQSWTLTHAFYADSGGFVLYSDDWVPFPITAKQLHYLVEYHYIPMPTISRKEIWDKSKADLFAKTIASAQAAWLVTQVIARGIQHLPVTVLELSTIALVACSAATSFFWLRKPLGVETPTALHLKQPIADLLVQAGDEAKQPFENTPLDFIESQIYTSSQLPLSRCWGVQERPLSRIPNDRDPRLHNIYMVLSITFPTAAFSLLHLIGWHFDFPTNLELLLWRWTCVSMTLVLGLYCITEAASIIRDGYTTSGLTTLNGYKLRWPTNLLFFIPGALYMFARVVVIVETIISLRLLPAACFQTVQWSELLPHL